MKNDRTNMMETEPIHKLLFKMALPAVAAQLVQLLYNIVDRIYVARIPGIGSLALAGLGVTFPILILISAFAALVGMGGAPRAAIAMGKKDLPEAERILGNSITLLLIFSVVLTVFFLAFKDPILLTFGASQNTLPYASEYLTIYLYGTIFVQIANGLNMFITNQGFAKTSMMTVLIGAVLNIILDPIFIFGFGMGVKGAAIATVISQAVSAIWVFKFLTGKKCVLRILPKNLKLSWPIVISIFSLGISPFIMQSTECLVQLVFNQGMQKYGNDMYVALMAILFSLMQLVFLPLHGFGQGAQPIISYNFGAGNQERAKKAFSFMFKINLCCSFIGTAIILLFPRFFIGFFTADSVLIETGVRPLQIFMFGMMFFGAQIACQQTFLAVGQAKISLVLASLRKIVLLVPLALILPQLFGLGLWGLFWAEPISDMIAVAATTIMFMIKRKTIFNMNDQKIRSQ